MKLTPGFIRDQIRREHVITRDVSYVTEQVEHWWANYHSCQSNHALKLQLISLLSTALRKSDKCYFENVGKNGVSAVCLTGVFQTDSYRLALIVHEALCELFHLQDIKYPYEHHKALFLKADGEKYRDWGNGAGEITPHSDDLYEAESTDLLALTVCRDKTSTPTQCFPAKTIIECLSDAELSRLAHITAIFRSGKNVSLSKSCKRKLVQYDPVYGVQLYLDFRIDTDVGERMVATHPEDAEFLRKLRLKIPSWTPVYSASATGTFFIMANYKVLHARPVIQSSVASPASLHKINFHDTPRLLFRSKGPRHNLSLAQEYSAYLLP